MTVVAGERRFVGQANGPDVELRVFGHEDYARYETLDGYTALYDPGLGLFCFARLESGALVSTGISLSEPAPADVVPHLVDSPAARLAKTHSRPQPK